LELSFIATPLVGMLSSITGAIPNILKAALLLAAGWVIASLLAMLVRRAGKEFAAKYLRKLDEKIEENKSI